MDLRAWVRMDGSSNLLSRHSGRLFVKHADSAEPGRESGRY